MLLRVSINGNERDCTPKKPNHADPVFIYRQPKIVFKQRGRSGKVKVYSDEEIKRFQEETVEVSVRLSAGDMEEGRS